MGDPNNKEQMSLLEEMRAHTKKLEDEEARGPAAVVRDAGVPRGAARVHRQLQEKLRAADRVGPREEVPVVGAGAQEAGPPRRPRREPVAAGRRGQADRQGVISTAGRPPRIGGARPVSIMVLIARANVLVASPVRQTSK